MEVTKCQFYQSSLALLLWLQKIERLMATKYDIDLPEMNYLASNLSPLECYDFYNLLSHRRAIRGQISIYAKKEKSRKISCVNLLATWITDPAESMFRSDENIELKLRQIGRKDLARWILGIIDSNLKRRHLDLREIKRNIEESEINEIVHDRIGERIIPITDMADNGLIIENKNIVVDRQATCIFWKVFFSCLILLLLVILFLCFYRFLYTKLRCICRRFGVPEGKEYCLPEQTYGTASCSNLPTCCARRKNLKMPKITDNDDTQNFLEKYELCNFPSTERKTDEIESEISEERCLLLDLAEKMSENYVTKDNKIFSIFGKNETIDFPEKSERYFLPASESGKSIFSTSVNRAKERWSNERISKNAFPAENVFFDRRNFGKLSDSRRAKSLSRGITDRSKKIDFSRSELISSRSPEENGKIVEVGKFARMNIFPDIQSPKWTSRSCDTMEKLRKIVSPSRGDEKILGNSKNSENNIFSSLESFTELSETYNELGMLFSELLKRQWRPCRRKYCFLTRKLKGRKISDHDSRKCNNRGKMNFARNIMINWDQRPACSSGNICQETYDEYKIMIADSVERKNLARSIIERRKCFLNQPCLSPVLTKSCEEFKKFSEN